MIRSKKITNAARGEDCTLEIVGVCNGNNETVVFAHFKDEQKGMGMKSSDVSGAFCCAACHDVVDGRVYNEGYAGFSDWYMRRATNRTLERLFEIGVLKVA
ncbi:MAG: nuclease domain-containing protein [Pseudomonadota bacterium]